MSKGKPVGKNPTINVISGAEGNILIHDIGIVYTQAGYMLYIDPEIQIVLDHIIKEHGAAAIKMNWHSPDLMVFIPPTAESFAGNLAQSYAGLTTPKDVEQDQSLEVDTNLTLQGQNTAPESDKTE